MISLKTKKQRITGKWLVENYFVDDVDSVAINQTAYSRIIDYSIVEKEQPFNGNNLVGKWFLEDKKKKLNNNVVYNQNTTSILFLNEGVKRWKIERLTNKEFWLSETFDGRKYLIKLRKTEDHD